MARLLDAVEGLVIPDHGLITVLGSGFDDFGDPNFTQNQLCYGGKDLLYLTSAANRTHKAAVVLEAWDQPAPMDDCPAWEVHHDVQVSLSTGEVFLSAMDERPISPTLRAGPPGMYHVHVDAAGRTEIRGPWSDPEFDAIPVGVERFRVRLWPAP
jgi:hypothetical protein